MKPVQDTFSPADFPNHNAHVLLCMPKTDPGGFQDMQVVSMPYGEKGTVGRLDNS